MKPTAEDTLNDPRWAAVLARNAAADGHFWYSVASTGVYCRPSCGARTPRPENVRFHASPAEAEQAGFRPCRRCRPDLAPRAERDAARVAALCRHIDTAESTPTLAELARIADWSPSHLQRVFKAVTGVSPREYARALKAGRVREALARAASVTEAFMDAGYGSSGRFYEQAEAVLGMTPGAFRAGGADAEIRFALGQCSLGAILVAESTRGICAISLGDDAETLLHELQQSFPHATLIGADAAFEQRVAQIVGLIEAPGTGTELPLDIRGTAFQQRVWQALRTIPAGETLSYAELAQRIGSPEALRAVGSACAANVLAVAIPCHRVVRSDGGLSGYRWGVERKQALLARERDDALRYNEPSIEPPAGSS
jgi:AraC family transcriptional regulator, regulatory protein of adaptative response / methylated-DNA-[protein]-cysteine methyltransferase